MVHEDNLLKLLFAISWSKHKEMGETNGEN